MPHSHDPSPVEWVSPSIIRRLFKEQQILERAESGELVRLLRADRHPEAPLAGEPLCTRSQLVCYYTHHCQLVAEAHQYLRPDGTLGLSGLPDPKRLVLPDKIVAVGSQPSDKDARQR